MKNSAFIHVIMPVYNVERYLRDAIDSVLAQTYTQYELILVNDGSPDNSGKICDEYAARYPHVRVIHKENGGVSSARNAGLKEVHDGYTVFVDSDDTVYPDMLENAVNVIERHNADVALFGMETLVFTDGVLEHTDTSAPADFLYDSQDAVRSHLRELLEKHLWNFSVDKIYRTDVIKQNRIWFPSYYDISGEDAVFLIELFPHIKKMAGTCKVGYRYAIRTGQSMVKSFRPDLFEKNIAKTNLLVKMTNEICQTGSCDTVLTEMFCNAVIWSYEQLFQKNCPYGLRERIGYIRKAYQTDRFSRVYKKKALYFLTHDRQYKQISRFSKWAAKHILKGNWFAAECIVFLESVYFKVRKINA